MHHSDQGSQYTALEFGKRCKVMGVRPSMGSVGDACDNAMAESFFASLECELIDRHVWPTKTEARLALFSYIEGWYNPRRRHNARGYQSPLNFERSHHDQTRTPPPSVEHDLTTVGVCLAGATPPVDKSAPALIDTARESSAHPSARRASPVQHAGELVSDGGIGAWLVHARAHAAIERAERGAVARQAHGRQFQRLAHALRRAPRACRQNRWASRSGPPGRDEDYLILSTIHSAKGQQWQAVFILNVVDGCIPSDMATGSAAEIDEERRLLYVAMTRAKQHLQLLVPQRFYVHRLQRTVQLIVPKARRLRARSMCAPACVPCGAERHRISRGSCIRFDCMRVVPMSALRF